MICVRSLTRALRKFLFVFIACFGLATFYLIWTTHFDQSDPFIDEPDTKELLNILGKQTSAKACVHPELQLWHPELAKYFKDPAPLTCNKEDENWVSSFNGTFKMSEKAKRAHGDILCEFVPFIRGDNDFTVTEGQPIKPIKDGDTIPADYGRVKCIGSTGKVYKNLLLGVSPIKSVFQKSHKFPANSAGLNILMFGFDSTSRMTWMRNLPRSHKYFVRELGGTVLHGYNIVGDGTPQALLPILTGKTEPELPEARRGFPNAKTVDDHPWLWKQLHKLGYVTQWGEDGAGSGTFTYRMLGFDNQPVSHYLRPFYIKAEQEYGKHRPYCLGSLPRHLNMLNWARDFFQVYGPKVPKFSFVFHSEFTHDGYSQVRVVDKDLENMLKNLQQDGYLDNTLLILMADHGARFQQVRQTMQGKYEERMPYFALRLPNAFTRAYPWAADNLRKNAHRLATPFDIHATFQHLLNWTDPSNEPPVSKTQRGISLFREIPSDRSCHDAEIEPHWCACLNWQNIHPSFPHVVKGANAVLDVINNLTYPTGELCRRLEVANISSAVVYSPNDKVVRFRKSSDIHGRNPDLSDNMQLHDLLFQITFETKPGGGKFEATVKYLAKTKKFVVDMKEISRINKYGDQPHCVADKLPHLRQFCYCVTQLQR